MENETKRGAKGGKNIHALQCAEIYYSQDYGYSFKDDSR
jgi:hypothetical protein